MRFLPTSASSSAITETEDEIRFEFRDMHGAGFVGIGVLILLYIVAVVGIYWGSAPNEKSRCLACAIYFGFVFSAFIIPILSSFLDTAVCVLNRDGFTSQTRFGWFHFGRCHIPIAEIIGFASRKQLKTKHFGVYIYLMDDRPILCHSKMSQMPTPFDDFTVVANRFVDRFHPVSHSATSAIRQASCAFTSENSEEITPLILNREEIPRQTENMPIPAFSGMKVVQKTENGRFFLSIRRAWSALDFILLFLGIFCLIQPFLLWLLAYKMVNIPEMWQELVCGILDTEYTRVVIMPAIVCLMLYACNTHRSLMTDVWRRDENGNATYQKKILGMPYSKIFDFNVNNATKYIFTNEIPNVNRMWTLTLTNDTGYELAQFEFLTFREALWLARNNVVTE
ncbi:MAG: hypothetical protein Q4C70_13100 [Planctomycetia bacterium]|nr:hypothetical protein [Planctomycetia bacterium]